MRRFIFTALFFLLILSMVSERPCPVLAQAGSTSTPQLITPVETATPQPDGSIIHEVQYGQALVMIASAYGVPMNELIALNNLNGTNPVLFIGQKLVIRLAPTATITSTATTTLRPPTRTATLMPTPVTPTVTRTITPTPTSTPRSLMPDFRKMNRTIRHELGYGILAVSVLGLLAVLFFGFRKK
ncbi:MAG TPA: LysM peptidoglycan-binding domain-containing protein [Longilinea sp.]|nr:LysM peptidoglycan-binding domain-containing protein [Longilinea sp.]